MLWTYCTTCKKLTGQAPLKLVYGQADVMPMEYIIPSLRVEAITKMTDVDSIEERLLQLIHLEEEHFIAGFHQNVEKQRHKAWHGKHIKNKQFTIGGLVLMYDNKFFKHPGKLETHLLGPYVVKEITDGGAVKLENLDAQKSRGSSMGVG